jgi:H+/gluconate symporter-like permease
MQEAGLVGECASSVSKGFVVTYVMEKVPGSINGGLTTTSTTMGDDYYVLGVPVNGFNFGGPTSFSSSAFSSSGSSVTATSTGISLPSPTESSAAGNGNLSTGAKAGIGVAAAVAGIAFIIFASLLFKYLRKRQGAEGNNNGGEKEPGDPVHELHDTNRPHEIGSSGARPSELAG